MTKARDLGSLLGASSQIDNTKITLDANEIPALDTAKITTGTFDASRIGSGTFADARISQSSVSQHATSFDDNKIVNDISTLALRQASDANRSAYNTNSQFVDVFQDATGIDTTTDVLRNANEYVSTGILSTGEFTDDANTLSLLHLNNNITDEAGISWTNQNGVSFNNTTKKFGSHSAYFNGTTSHLVNQLGYSHFYNNVGSGDFTIESWFYLLDQSNPRVIFNWNDDNTNTQSIIFGYLDGGNSKYSVYGNYSVATGWQLEATNESFHTGNGSVSSNTWHHLAFTKDGGTNRLYLDGVQKASNTASFSPRSDTIYAKVGGGEHGFFYGYLDEFRFSNVCRYPSGTTFTPNLAILTNATGNFTGTTITAPSSVSSMGAIITYQDNAGTNALNTDIVLQLSADGGSNWSTATLSALPNFSTGIKMAKVNDLAVTAGTQLKYRINFANQASGSKEARIRGVALQY